MLRLSRIAAFTTSPRVGRCFRPPRPLALLPERNEHFRGASQRHLSTLALLECSSCRRGVSTGFGRHSAIDPATVKEPPTSGSSKASAHSFADDADSNPKGTPLSEHFATGGTTGDGGATGAADTNYDPWAILSLKPGASTNEVRMRYHDLVKECHPEYATNGTGDLHRFNEIDKAYQLITRAPALDKRYRNLITESQYVYYKLLPQWMAKNVDEMPRYWSWLRWKFSSRQFFAGVALFCFLTARFGSEHPKMTTLVFVTFLVDCLIHTMAAPVVFILLFYKAIVANPSYDLAWFHSPKGMLRRSLGY